MEQEIDSPDEGLFYEDLIQEYTQAPRFVRRPWLEELVNEALDQPGCRFVLLTGEPGAGKSAFMAQLAAAHPRRPRYFIRRDQRTPLEDAGASAFLLKTGFQLAASYPEVFAQEQIEITIEQSVGTVEERGRVVAAQVEKLIASPFYQRVIEIRQEVTRNQGSMVGIHIGEWVSDPNLISLSNLQQMALIHPAKTFQRLHPGERIVILVDALDELRYRLTGDNLLDWLAEVPKLPDNIRFILTSRDDSDLLKRLRGAQKPFLQECSIPAQGKDILADLDTYARSLAANPEVEKRLHDNQGVEAFVQVAIEKAEGNIGYLDALGRAVDQALARQDQALLDAYLKLSQLPRTIQGLYAFFLQQIKDGVDYKVMVEDAHTLEVSLLEAWPAVYRRILGVLSVARQALSPQQIRAMGGILAGLEDVHAALERLRQFLDAVDGGYRFYHATLPEFLTAEDTNQDPGLQDIAVRPVDWHRRIVAYFGGAAGDWKVVEWEKMDAYGLRYLAEHLYALREDPGYRKDLHALLQDQGYAAARLQHWRDPSPLLGDLRLGLSLALEDNDLAQVWLYIRRNRALASEQQTTLKVAQDIQANDFTSALARTNLFGALPNSQALLRLWIAWKAISQGRLEAASEAARRALGQLPPGGLIANSLRAVDPNAKAIGQDALAEALARMLLRVARSSASSQDTQADWLSQVGMNWDEKALKYIRSRLPEPLESWGAMLEAHEAQQPMGDLLDLLQDRVVIDQAGNFREASYLYQRMLAGGLFANRHSPQWQDYVRQAVELISLDSYPSYREMALAWIATAVLAHPDEGEAQRAMFFVLGGALDQPVPDFWGDSSAAVLAGFALSSGKGLRPTELLKALGKVNPEVRLERHHIPPGEKAGGQPIDPWAFSMRQRSAVAAVLRRQKQKMRQANSFLNKAHSEAPWSSYAGYRVLARLSLACRWLEWGRKKKAVEQLGAAREDAIHMLDPVLSQERLDLIAAFAGWLQEVDTSKEPENSAACLRKARDQMGMQRSLYLQYLSAIWYPDIWRLKALLLLALEDATATDAVLGRLIGALSLGEQPGISFERLVEVMGLEALT